MLPRSLGGSTCGEGSNETPEMMEGEGCQAGLEGGLLFLMSRVQDGFDGRFQVPEGSIPSSSFRDHPKVSKDFYIREIQKLVIFFNSQ